MTGKREPDSRVISVFNPNDYTIQRGEVVVEINPKVGRWELRKRLRIWWKFSRGVMEDGPERYTNV